MILPYLGICVKECKSTYTVDNWTSMFIVALFTIAKLWSQPRCPSVDEHMKEIMVYVPNAEVIQT
jgi:hypothetical protein